MSDTEKSPDRLIRHTVRLRESVMLRLAQLKTSDVVRRGGASWSDTFEYLLGLGLGRDVPPASTSEATSWPGSVPLTPYWQRVAEAALIVNRPWLMESKSFRTAYAAVRHAPYGPDRARLFEFVLDSYSADAMNTETTPAADMERGVKRQLLRQEIKAKVEGEFGRAQWERGSASGSQEDLDRRRERHIQRVEGEIFQVPTYAEALEEAGLPRAAEDGVPQVESVHRPALADPGDDWRARVGTAGETDEDFRRAVEENLARADRESQESRALAARRARPPGPDQRAGGPT
jgi:hypothetical protein